MFLNAHLLGFGRCSQCRLKLGLLALDDMYALAGNALVVFLSPTCPLDEDLDCVPIDLGILHDLWGIYGHDHIR